MKKHILLTNLFILAACFTIIAQDFSIDNTRTEYNGHRLSVKYDLKSKKQSEKFYILVEILKEDGTPVRAKSFLGDIGDEISPGDNKSIIWVPEDDAIFLDDTVSIEIKAEKYTRSYNKGTAIFSSALLPGLGQTKISQGKPWWLAGIAAYGTLAGGFVFQNNYQKNYDAYAIETDPLERSSLFDQSQKDKQISNTLFISAAALWLGNLIWVAAAPNEYKELRLPQFTVNTFAVDNSREMIPMLSLTIDF